VLPPQPKIHKSDLHKSTNTVMDMDMDMIKDSDGDGDKQAASVQCIAQW
jgi:hypothetical protein